jgi:uncharacterized repeat protein (TIGR03803 family)
VAQKSLTRGGTGRLPEELTALPEDGASQGDRHLYGHPKRPPKRSLTTSTSSTKILTRCLAVKNRQYCFQASSERQNLRLLYTDAKRGANEMISTPRRPVSLLIVCTVYACLIAPAAAQAPGFILIYSFVGGYTDGQQPQGGMILAPGGSLYGTTYFGGAFGGGTLFQLTPSDSSWTYNLVFNVGGPSGSDALYAPDGGIATDRNGALYITAQYGDKTKGGGVLQVSPPSLAGGPWTGTAIHSFNDHGNSGRNSPTGPLLYTPDGMLYGVVSSNDSTLSAQTFVLIPPAGPGGHWGEGSPFTFTPEMGNEVYGGLTPLGGVFYGAAFHSVPPANPSCSAVDEIVPPAGGVGSWTGSVIHAFAGAPSDGCGSWGTLAVGSDGSLYGTTMYGGSGICPNGYAGCGTVYQLTPPTSPGGPWTETILYNFGGVSAGYDGANPMAGVVIAQNGKLYGTTQRGGIPCEDIEKNPSGCGTVFELAPPDAPGSPWIETTLFRFDGHNGLGPFGPVTLTRTGALVGTTYSGGANKMGTIFSIQP